MKILKFKKIGKSKYKVMFDNNELSLYEDVIIKYNLLVKKNLTLEDLNKILEENKYFEIYNIALNYIGIKMRSAEEIKRYLEKKNFDISLINNIIERLTNEGYINEKKYITAYINDKINLSNDGPYKIKQSLMNLKIDEYKIEEYLNTINEDIWIEKLDKIIEKRKKISNKLSTYTFFNKTKIYLYNLGYPTNLIEERLSNVKIDNNIENEYKKAYNKYSKKYEGDKLNYNIKNYLYRKGYTIDEINSIIKPQ